MFEDDKWPWKTGGNNPCKYSKIVAILEAICSLDLNSNYPLLSNPITI